MFRLLTVTGHPEHDRSCSKVSHIAESLFYFATDGAPIDCTTVIHSTQTFVNVMQQFLSPQRYILLEFTVCKLSCSEAPSNVYCSFFLCMNAVQFRRRFEEG